ncbi:MAG: extracellular solute-binding protein [Hyphomicrobiales bacterium]|nr:extracellular solute-binding protein [Hyphomicrobiales bacterium]
MVLHRLPWTIVPAAFAFLMAGSPLAAQVAATEPIYLYKGADREQRLVAKAREEGTLTFYTSMATTESGPLAQAFEKKYGVKVQLWRALSENVLQRAITEARGGRRGLDVVETNAPEVEALAREQVVATFDSPHIADLPAWAVPEHRRWFADRANLWVTGFNTAKLKRDDLPTALEGFADPRWKGRLAIEATDSDWMYGLVNFMGEARGLEFFRKLAALKPEMRKGHILVAQLVAAGELLVCLTVYSGNADSIKSKGGPIDWLAVEPLVGRPQAIALARNAPHPHAALLFADFVLSPEGQKLLADMGRVPASRTQKTLLDQHKHVMVDPIRWIDEAAKWEKIWTELFLR